MRRVLAATTIVTVMALAPARAGAATDLASGRPLRGGPGGIICSCMNLTSETIVVKFAGQSSNAGTFTCDDRSVRPGAVQACGTVDTAATWSCRVARVDGASASPTELACSLAAFDSQGKPIAVVPMDKVVGR
jgi:hypothetical protein